MPLTTPAIDDAISRTVAVIGLASMVVEGLVVCVGGGVLARRRPAAGLVTAGVAPACERYVPATTPTGIATGR